MFQFINNFKQQNETRIIGRHKLCGNTQCTARVHKRRQQHGSLFADGSELPGRVVPHVERQYRAQTHARKHFGGIQCTHARCARRR